jgi:hypothetical protein
MRAAAEMRPTARGMAAATKVTATPAATVAPATVLSERGYRSTQHRAQNTRCHQNVPTLDTHDLKSP